MCLFLVTEDDYSGAGNCLFLKTEVANFITPLPPILLLILLQNLYSHLLSLSLEAFCVKMFIIVVSSDGPISQRSFISLMKFC